MDTKAYFLGAISILPIPHEWVFGSVRKITVRLPLVCWRRVPRGSWRPVGRYEWPKVTLAMWPRVARVRALVFSIFARFCWSRAFVTDQLNMFISCLRCFSLANRAKVTVTSKFSEFYPSDRCVGSYGSESFRIWVSASEEVRVLSTRGSFPVVDTQKFAC